MLVEVLRDNGSGAFSWIIYGIIYAATNDADVISVSIGGSLQKSGACDPALPDDCYTAREANELKSAVARATTWASRARTTSTATVA